MSAYGYSNRDDGPSRITNVPGQATPDSQLPRAVDHAIKNPPTSSATLQQIVAMYQPDAQQVLFGLTPGSTDEGHAGSTTITNEYWWSEISRFVRYVEITNAGTNDKRINRTGIAYEISPQSLLDPAKPSAPFIWRFEDICAARLHSPSAGHKGLMYFGTTWESAVGVALVAPKPFIGIYALMSGTAYGTWTARCVNDAGSGLDQSLGITTELPHRLAYAIDGRGQVIFSIDGVDLVTYDTTGSDLGTDTIFAIDHRWCVGADDGATIRAGYMMDLQTIVSVEVLDEAA